MTLDNSQFVRGLRGAQGKAREFAQGMKQTIGPVAAMFGVGSAIGIAAGIKRATDNMSRMLDLAKRSGSDFEEFQRLAQHMREAGVNTDETANALVRMQRKIAEAAAGNKGLNTALKALGINIKDIKDQNPIEQFLQFSDALKKSGNSAEALSNLFKFLEDDAKKMRDAMKEGRQAIIDNGKTIDTVSEASMRRIKEVEKQWERMKTNIQAGIVTRVSIGIQMGKLLQFVKDLIPREGEIVEGDPSVTGRNVRARIRQEMANESRSLLVERLQFMRKENVSDFAGTASRGGDASAVASALNNLASKLDHLNAGNYGDPITETGGDY